MDGTGAGDRQAVLGVDDRRRRLRPFAQFAAMRDVAGAMAKGADGETVFGIVAEHAADMVDADGCALVRFGDDGVGQLTGHWARDGMFPQGVPDRVRLVGDSAVPLVARTGRPAVVASYADLDDPRGRLLSTEYQSGAAVPIFVGMGPWGAVAVGSRRVDAFDDRTVERLEDFAELIALAVASPVPESRSGLEALLDTLLTSAPIGFAYLGLGGRVLRANAAFAAMGGTTPWQLAGRQMGDLIERFPMLAQADLDAMTRTGNAILDVPSQVADGDGTRYFVTSFYPVRAAAVEGFGVVVVDVTPQGRTAEALRRERNYSDAIVDALQDGLAVSDLDGTLIDVNERLCRMTGFTREELIGSPPPYPYWPAGRVGDLRRSLADALAGEVTGGRVEFVRSDGSPLWAVVARSPLRGDAGRMRGLVATVSDVTAERHAERERQGLLSAERLARRRAQILHALGSGLSRALTPGEVRSVLSDHASRLLGATCCDVLLPAGSSLTPPTAGWVGDWDTSVDAASLMSVAASGVGVYPDHPAAVAQLFPGLQASSRAVGSAAAVPFGGGECGRGVLVVGFAVDREFSDADRLMFQTVADLTAQALHRAHLYEAERASAELLRQRDASRVAMLRGVSHEFRSPLTAIANAAAALEQVTDAQDRRDLAAVVGTETRRLDRFVANVLDLSRLEGDLLEPRFDWCSTVELVAGALEAVAALTGDVSIASAADGDVPLVRADPVLTERILINLLHNAVRHGGDPIRIDVEHDLSEVRFVVTDGGSGVRPGTEESIFAPFVGDKERGGLGLGLALSRGLAEVQGGRLWLGPADTGGRFVLALPLRLGTDT